MITATQQLENYLESFSEFEKLAAGHDLPWLRKLRRDAFARFCEVGFPTTHDEDWRFTNVSAIAQTPFRLAPERPRPAVTTGTGAVPGSRALPLNWCSWTGALRANSRCFGKLPCWGEGQQSGRGDCQQSRSD